MTLNAKLEWKNLLAQPQTVALLTAADANGEPHTVLTDSLHLDSDGHLVYLEYLESSQINKNLVRSLWFKKKISVTLLGTDGANIQLKGIPSHVIVAGPLFESYYRSVRDKIDDGDLSTVWQIDVLDVIDESWQIRKEDQDLNHAIVAHLDRLSK